MNFSTTDPAGKRLVLPILILLLAMSVRDAASQEATESDSKFLSGPEFVLSPEAVAAGIDGRMLVSVVIDKTGTVKRAKIVWGPAWPCSVKTPKEELAGVHRAVNDNILASKFSPAIKNGKPREAWLTMEVIIGEAYKRAIKEKDLKEALKAGIKTPLVRTGELNSRALDLPKPDYSFARAQEVYGSATVEVVIAEDGRVASAGNTGGHQAFSETVRKAACMAKFRPTLVAGEPVKVVGTITYIFELID